MDTTLTTGTDEAAANRSEAVEALARAIRHISEEDPWEGPTPQHHFDDAVALIAALNAGGYDVARIEEGRLIEFGAAAIAAFVGVEVSDSIRDFVRTHRAALAASDEAVRP